MGLSHGDFHGSAGLVPREKLSAHPLLKGRKIQFVRLAMPGYKQPQHLMAYNFLLTLGAEFDALVNIDGYNETVLTICENAKSETAISYPRAWHGRVISMADPSVSADAARLLQLRGKRQQMAKNALTSIWRWSHLYNLVWLIRDRSAWNELTDLGLKPANPNGKALRRMVLVDSQAMPWNQKSQQCGSVVHFRCTISAWRTVRYICTCCSRINMFPIRNR